MQATSLETSTAVIARWVGKHLTFALGREFYGIPALQVREIIRLCEITFVPNLPPYVKGVLNLRGRIIPVIDLRQRFGLAAAEATERTCIVVVQLRTTAHTNKVMGLMVDGVEEVANLTQEDIEPTPDFGPAVEASYILGIAKIKGVVKVLLDIDQILGNLPVQLEG